MKFPQKKKYCYNLQGHSPFIAFARHLEQIPWSTRRFTLKIQWTNSKKGKEKSPLGFIAHARTQFWMHYIPTHKYKKCMYDILRWSRNKNDTNAIVCDHTEVLGIEPIKITLSLCLCSLVVSGFALANNPENNPTYNLELDLLPSKSKALLTSPLAL